MVRSSTNISITIILLQSPDSKKPLHDTCENKFENKFNKSQLNSILLTFYLLSYINDTTPKNNKIKAHKIKSSNITKQNKMKYNPNSQYCFSGAPAKCGDKQLKATIDLNL